MKTFLKSILLLTASSLFALVLCEVIVRLVAPQRLDNNLDCFEPDDNLVYRMQRNFKGTYANFEFEIPVTVNSRGFRDQEFRPKREGTYRIIGVGDSYTFGNGVRLEETYLKQFEACLKNSRRDSVEVLNCGVPGYGPSQYSLVAQATRTLLRADMVILGFFVGNDFVDSGDLYDAKGNATIQVHDGKLTSNKATDENEKTIRKLTAPVRYLLSTRSHLYVFVRNRSSELLSRFGLRPYNLPPEFCEAEYGPRMTRHWNITKKVLNDFAAFAKDHNVRFLVVILPTIYQVYQTSWDEYINGLHLQPDRYDLDKPQRLLAEFFQTQGIDHADVLPLMRVQAQQARLFYPVDGHLTAEGHHLVAQALCDALRNLSTTPNDGPVTQHQP